MPLHTPATLTASRLDTDSPLADRLLRAPTTGLHQGRGGRGVRVVEVAPCAQGTQDGQGTPLGWPTNRPEWIAAAARHLCPPDALRHLPALDAGAQGDAVERLPMALYTPAGRRAPRLTLPGAHVTGEPCDLPGPAAAGSLRQLAAQPLAIELPRVPADSPTPSALRRTFAGRALVRVFEAPGSPYVTLDDSWIDPLQRFNAGRRSDIRRAEQHARRLGGARFEFHDDIPEETLPSLLDEAFEVEARSWKGEAGSALAGDPPMGRFVREVAHAAARSGTLRLAFLRVDGRAAAMQIALASAQRLWLLKIGYDPAFARCRPGHLLLLQTLSRAAGQGLRSCEFMGHAAPWTAQWTDTLRACVGVRVYPLSLSGLHAWAEDGADGLRRRIDALRRGAE
jgi:CelD/BcsL family acetyltransferase involved in cellulose biosynthesis